MKKTKFIICPITYEPLTEAGKYSEKGLKTLSPKLRHLNDLPLSAEALRSEARQRADKMSIQGIQPKVSAILNLKTESFELCDIGGRYILKPQSEYYSEVPENEDLSMRLASSVGIKVPVHGLLYCKDDSLTYFIKRFDRLPRNKKVVTEDFAQLSGLTRDTKYNFSMEKLIPVIEKFCTFPVLEKKELLIRTLFNYLIGNEDMHVKNFSVIYHNDKVELAPAYDFLNTTLAMGRAKEEIALPLNGKKRNLKRKDFIEYYGFLKLGLNEGVIEKILTQLSTGLPIWEMLIRTSFLSKDGKEKYLKMIEHRAKQLNI